MLGRALLRVAAAMAICAGAQATTISATATNTGGSVWRYDFALSSFSNGAGAGFTIYFPLASVTALANPVASGEWDAIVLTPDSPPGSDGAFDALALTGSPSLIPFSVEATIASGAAPLVLRFEIYRSNPFAVLEAGNTFDPASGAAVPEPSGGLLMWTGATAFLLQAARARRRRPRRA